MAKIMQENNHTEKTVYKKSDFYYELPEELIAQTPAEPRDSSRLLVYSLQNKTIEDKIFHDLPEYLRPGDVLVVGSVSGRTASVVDLAYEAKKMGVHVIAFISMKYATQVEPVHSSGRKLYEMVDLVMDNCAPAAEGMMDVEGIEAPYAAASGIASDYILWSMTSVAVDELLARGITPGILKSANFPGGNDYNKTVIEPHYEKYGW